jgi:hypothetical protein
MTPPTSNPSKEKTMTFNLKSASLMAFLALPGAAIAQDATMSFFITSQNPGNGANLGGIAGADAHCSALAEAAGVTGKSWAAYLSTSTQNARDRIGTGPWVNAKGVVVATDVDNLHSAQNNLSKDTALNEKGEIVNGRGDDPNRHDILTGSDANGVLSGGTCEDWTSAAEDGSTMVGHFDRQGGGADPTSWNAAHATEGCHLAGLQSTGGDGLLYCFATQ